MAFHEAHTVALARRTLLGVAPHDIALVDAAIDIAIDAAIDARLPMCTAPRALLVAR